MNFKSYDIIIENEKWTRIEAKNKYVEIKQPYSIDQLRAAIKLLEYKINAT